MVGLFLLPWLKASLCAVPMQRIKTSTLSKGDDVSRGKNPACSSPTVQLWLSLCSKRALPHASALCQRERGEMQGQGLAAMALGKRPLSLLSRELCHELGWDEASVQPSHLERRGKPQVGFCVGEGCWGWEEVAGAIVWVFSALQLVVQGAGLALCWAPSPGGEESTELNGKKDGSDGSGSSCWELEWRFAQKPGAVSS